MNTLENVNTTQLAEQLASGLASEDERGIVLRTLQTALGVNLVSNLETVKSSFASLEHLLEKTINTFSAKLNDMIESDTIDYSSLFEIMTTLQKNQVSFLELQRKIIQSPNKLFGDDLLSADEKKLLTILKSFKTQKDKENFIKAVDKAMQDINCFEITD